MREGSATSTSTTGQATRGPQKYEIHSRDKGRGNVSVLPLLQAETIPLLTASRISASRVFAHSFVTVSTGPRPVAELSLKVISTSFNCPPIDSERFTITKKMTSEQVGTVVKFQRPCINSKSHSLQIENRDLYRQGTTRTCSKSKSPRRELKNRKLI